MLKSKGKTKYLSYSTVSFIWLISLFLHHVYLLEIGVYNYFYSLLKDNKSDQNNCSGQDIKRYPLCATW